jgi:integrase/recombinase XerD
MKLSHACAGFLLHKAAEGKSERTLTGYKTQLALLTTYLGDPEMAALDTAALRAFLAWLRTDYHSPRPIAAPAQLSAKTLRNYWITLRSFVTWAMAECAIPDIIKTLEPPEFQSPEIAPLTEANVQAILAAVTRTRPSQANDKHVAYTTRRPTARRDRALILLLLDTGLRASEVARLRVDDVDLTTGAVLVVTHNSGRKSRPRTTYLGNTARKSLWRYLSNRPAAGSAPLFATSDGKSIGCEGVRFICRYLGEKAGIHHCYPHKFRHTFALNFLRNGGDIFSLQRILGHTSLDMVRRYLALVRDDVAGAHRRASPADNWNL